MSSVGVEDFCIDHTDAGVWLEECAGHVERDGTDAGHVLVHVSPSLHLPLMEAAVEVAGVEEFFMRSVGNNVSLVEDKNSVGQ